MRQLGWSSDAKAPIAIKGYDSARSQGQSEGSLRDEDDEPDCEFKFDEKKDRESESGRIDFQRHTTHRIFNVAEEVKNRNFKRNCRIHYTTDKEGQKKYLKKDLELKIEFYERLEQSADQGERKGYRLLNLSDYIGRGLVTECFNMDMVKNKSRLFLTVKLSVVSANDGVDIAMIALMANQNK